MKLIRRQLIYVGLLSALGAALGGQACSTGFQSALKIADNASIASAVDMERLQGKALYDSKCAACHGPIETSAKAGATASRIASALDVQPPMAALRSMPANDIRLISLALTSELPILTCDSAPDVGHVTLHRLNNIEYNNTLRDLLGITYSASAASAFPSDEFSSNFNNNAKVLGITPTLVAKYLDSAQNAVDAAFADSKLKARLVNCDLNQATCRNNVLASFLLKAFRRPPSASELAYSSVVAGFAAQEGDSVETGVKLAMVSALISPNFLYRAPSNPAPSNPNSTVLLSDYELASRLSYFIWSSLPDETLFEAARLGQLRTREQLSAQVRRMMKDPKAASLIDGFATQWMHLNNFDSVALNTSIYPAFNNELRNDLRTETKMFLKDIFDRDGSFYDLLSADYTFLNSRLAANYGISGVSGTDFKKVSLAGVDRIGIMAHGSLLAVNANPDRTSIVKRGKWVLENLLCTPPPPPPPEVVGKLPESNANLSPRQRMEQHRANPTCFSCHAQMDPIGFALENYDPLGRYRTSDSSGQIDNRGEFPDGRTFAGARELAKTVADDKRFRLCVAEKLFIFSLGRQPETFDRCTINRIGSTVVAKDQPISAAIIEMVNSDPFRKSRGEGN